VRYFYIQNFLIIKKIKLLYNLTYFANHVNYFLEIERFIKFYIIILQNKESVPDEEKYFGNKLFLRKMFHTKVVGFKKICLLILSV